MSQQLNVGTIDTPDFATVLDQVKTDVMTATNCHRVGTIQSFNAALQTASVTINQQAQVGSKVYSFPLLTDVPVFVMTGGATGVITMPVNTGDTCLVLFHDRDLDNWFATGNTTTPNTPRTHSLSDGMAIVGFRSKANPVSDYSSTAIEVRNLGSKISVAETIQIMSTLIGMTSTAGGQVVVADKILIANSATNLRALLQLFINALDELNAVKDGGSASGSISAAAAALPTLLT